MKSPVLNITGKVKGIGKAKQVTDRFRVRSLWLDFDDSYVSNGEAVEKFSTPEFQFAQEKCDLLDQFKPGDMVTVKFQLEGRKWEKDGRSGVFTQAKAFDIASIPDNGTPEPVAVTDAETIDDDDLPF